MGKLEDLADQAFDGSIIAKTPYLIQAEQICDALDEYHYNYEMVRLLENLEQQLREIINTKKPYSNIEKSTLKELENKNKELINRTNYYVNALTQN